MATPILNIPTVAASQNQKEVTINDAIAALEAAGNDVTTVTVDVTNALTLTDAQWREAGTIRVDPDGVSAPTAAITLTVPAIKRQIVLVNKTGFAVNASITGQTEPAVEVPDDAAVSVVSDGVDLWASGGGAGGGASDFISLTDTPATFTGQGGHAVAVNAGETALEFVAFPVGGGSAHDVTSFRAKRATTQAITLNTLTVVTFDAEDFDTDNIHSAGVVTIPAALNGAEMAFYAGVRFAAGTTGFMYIQHSGDGGTTWVEMAEGDCGNPDTSVHTQTGPIAVATGDQIRVVVETTGNETIQANDLSFFSGYVLPPDDYSALDLTDTPAAYGTAGQALIVNDTEDGLEFGDVASGGGGTLVLDPSTLAHIDYRTFTDLGMGDDFADGIDPKWTITGATAGTVEHGAAPAGALYDTASIPGVVLLQAPSGTSDVTITQSTALGTGEEVILCVAPGWSTTTANNNGILGLRIATGDQIYFDGTDNTRIQTLTGGSLSEYITESGAAGRWVYFRAHNDGTKITLSFSADGENWAAVDTTVSSPTMVEIFFSTANASTVPFTAALKWVRHTTYSGYRPYTDPSYSLTGNAGKALIVNAAEDGLEFGGVVNPLATYGLTDKAFSTDVTVDIALPSGHDAVVIEGYFTPSLDASFDFFFSTDGGVSWLNGVSDYGHSTWTFSATGGAAWASASAAIQGFDAQPNGGERQYIRLEIRDYGDASLKTTVRWKSWGLLGTASPAFTEGFGVANTAAAHDAFRIKGSGTDLSELNLSVWDCATVNGDVGGASGAGTSSTLLTITNDIATSRTLALADAGTYVRMDNASPNTVTVPPNSSAAFEVGTQVNIRQAGAGQTTVAAGAGVTINTPETLKLRGQHSAATLIKVDTDGWDLMGDLEAAP